MIVYLVRHGECVFEEDNRVLTGNGRENARKTREYLDKICSGNIETFTSTLARSIESGAGNKQLEYLNEYSRSKEDFGEFIARVRYCIDQLEKSDIEIVVIHGHSIYFSALISIIAGANPEKLKDLAFRFDYCSISKLEYNKDHWKVLKVNDISHLY